LPHPVSNGNRLKNKWPSGSNLASSCSFLGLIALVLTRAFCSATPIYRAPLKNGARPGGPGGAGAPGSSGGGGGFRAGMPSGEHKPPPLGYICYRCGQKGGFPIAVPYVVLGSCSLARF
jgi:hypothetical protein